MKPTTRMTVTIALVALILLVAIAQPAMAAPQRPPRRSDTNTEQRRSDGQSQQQDDRVTRGHPEHPTGSSACQWEPNYERCLERRWTENPRR